MGTLDGVDILKNPPAEESKVKEVSVLEIGEVLKKRKEAMAALHLLLTGEEEEPAEVGNKVKRIVKKSVAVDRINSMRANPCSTFQELSPEVLNSQSQEFLVTYNRSRIFDQKVRAYEQALIQQYDSHGYAEDEIEVTDCSEDEIEVTVDEGMVDKITGCLQSYEWDINKFNMLLQSYEWDINKFNMLLQSYEWDINKFNMLLQSYDWDINKFNMLERGMLNFRCPTTLLSRGLTTKR
nr:unnamed protein product [Digitaria exilis]